MSHVYALTLTGELWRPVSRSLECQLQEHQLSRLFKMHLISKYIFAWLCCFSLRAHLNYSLHSNCCCGTLHHQPVSLHVVFFFFNPARNGSHIYPPVCTTMLLKYTSYFVWCSSDKKDVSRISLDTSWFKMQCFSVILRKLVLNSSITPTFFSPLRLLSGPKLSL